MNKKEYLLVCVAEEAGEVVQEAMKIARFGDKYKDKNHWNALILEMHDLVAVFEMLLEDKLKEEINYSFNFYTKKAKKDKTVKNFQRSAEVGRLIDDSL